VAELETCPIAHGTHAAADVDPVAAVDELSGQAVHDELPATSL
jgi:hypothetical protein